MAKNRNKKKKNESGPKAMDVTLDNHTVTDIPQAMDTSETVSPKAFAGGQLRSTQRMELCSFHSRIEQERFALEARLHHIDLELRKMKMGKQMKRSKNMRKKKAIAKAISLNDKSEEKVSKNESKTLRTKVAKNLYE